MTLEGLVALIVPAALEPMVALGVLKLV